MKRFECSFKSQARHINHHPQNNHILLWLIVKITFTGLYYVFLFDVCRQSMRRVDLKKAVCVLPRVFCLTWLPRFNTCVSIRNAFLIPLRNDTDIFDQSVNHDCQFHFFLVKKKKSPLKKEEKKKTTLKCRSYTSSFGFPLLYYFKDD